MLEKLKSGIADRVLSHDGAILKKSISKLTGENRRKEIQKTSQDLGIEFGSIIKEIQGSDYTAIQQEFSNTAQSYGKYFDKLGDQNFKTAQEIFLLLNEYVNKCVSGQKNRLTNILFKHPGIEDRFAIIEKMLEINQSTIEAKSMPESIKEQISEEDKTRIFINKIKEILISEISDEEKRNQISDTFLSVFEMKNRSRKKFYRVLGLAEEHISSLKDIDLNIVSNLIAQKAQQDSLSGVKVVGKIDLPKDPQGERRRQSAFNGKENQEHEIIQEETTSYLSLVGKTMNIREFLSSFSLDYLEIQDHIDTQISVPGRYFNSTTDAKKNKLHFFTVGSEKRGQNDTLINVSIMDNEANFEDGKIYEIVLTEMTGNLKAKDNLQKQNYFIKGVSKQNFDKFNMPGNQLLGDNPTLKELAENKKY